MKPRANLTPDEKKRWRVPDVGGPFSVASPKDQTLREYAVPNWLADVLERSEGVRWQWNLPDFVPLVGGKDAYVGFTKLNNALKSPTSSCLPQRRRLTLLSARCWGRALPHGLPH